MYCVRHNSVCLDMSKHRPSHNFCTVSVGRKIAKFLPTRCIKKHILQGLGARVQAASAWGVPASRAGCALMHVHLGSPLRKQAHGSHPCLPSLSLNFPGGVGGDFSGCAIGRISGQIWVKDHSGKKKKSRKKIWYFSAWLSVYHRWMQWGRSGGWQPWRAQPHGESPL